MQAGNAGAVVNTTVPKWGSPEWKKYYANLQAPRPITPVTTAYRPSYASYTNGGRTVGYGQLHRKSRKSKSRKSKSRKSKSRK